MKNLQIKSKLISLEEQIEILEKVKERITSQGLCDIIRFTILMTKGKICFDGIYSYIPLFTRENAIKYGGGGGGSVVTTGGDMRTMILIQD